MELWSLFTKGGYVMWAILFCSVLALGIGIERLLFYRSVATQGRFNGELLPLMEKKDFAGALALAKENKGDCAKLAALYLAQEKDDLTELESRANLALDTYEEHINLLDMIVTVSPLLGLLGTIVGMISAFKVFELRSGQPFAITAGIGEALIATAFGLMVAIWALAWHCLLQHCSGRLSSRLKECCAILELRKTGAL